MRVVYEEHLRGKDILLIEVSRKPVDYVVLPFGAALEFSMPVSHT